MLFQGSKSWNASVSHESVVELVESVEVEVDVEDSHAVDVELASSVVTAIEVDADVDKGVEDSLIVEIIALVVSVCDIGDSELHSSEEIVVLVEASWGSVSDVIASSVVVVIFCLRMHLFLSTHSCFLTSRTIWGLQKQPCCFSELSQRLPLFPYKYLSSHVFSGQWFSE